LQKSKSYLPSFHRFAHLFAAKTTWGVHPQSFLSPRLLREANLQPRPVSIHKTGDDLPHRIHPRVNSKFNSTSDPALSPTSPQELRPTITRVPPSSPSNWLDEHKVRTHRWDNHDGRPLPHRAPSPTSVGPEVAPLSHNVFIHHHRPSCDLRRTFHLDSTTRAGVLAALRRIPSKREDLPIARSQQQSTSASALDGARCELILHRSAVASSLVFLF